MRTIRALLYAVFGLASMGVGHAAEVLVETNITTSTTWTADNVYNLQDQIYVLPGATLTIEAGTVIASTPTVDGSGSLAVTRGAKIFVNGTAEDPVIMTSTADVNTWNVDNSHPTGRNPKSGTWREAANEWGNLTIMGDALISEDAFPGNTQTPTGLNQGQMEGLVPPVGNEDRAYYGGDNDDDDSGSISYLSIRYGGRVVTINEELNGLSLGGIGRATDIDHVEIMNNVDDGIEIWGGTVNLKYVSIWNIGDDSFDIDQGWRGKAQFGLIVQGYSLDTSQGSGVGDNMFEHDGAEDSDAQPVTTARIHNFTAIGQPAPGAGDGATAWRDNARVQYRNCIFMDCGEQIVRPDGDDGDGASGYGHNGTLTFAQTWTTPAGTHSSVNDGGLSAAELDALYPVQTDGFLAEIRDSVFYRNNDADAYTEAIARGVVANSTPGAQPNDNVIANLMPIRRLTRGSAVTKGGKTMLPVTKLDPTAMNDARDAVDTAEGDFFSPADFRGGFGPDADDNWLAGWSASSAFGFLEANNEIEVTENIEFSQTWTANNVYNLQDQIYVLPGATLTIEAGTVIASTPTVDGAGSLAVTRGAQIFVQGTAKDPVIMTSTADVDTWVPDATHPTGGDPKSGVWREAANEWGNLTIMGDALISEDAFPGNTQTPTGLNQGQMEGLVPPVGNEDRAYYGGDNDDDDSGSISYLSIRYGGRVVTINEELNGLSLGGIGRATDIDHVEIMNNVDDGIEIWGGTVNLKYVSIWNIGDDSFDIDQGWRGKAQFGLIVQGYSLDTSQGSGVGDNMFEHDGAEDSDAQPVTTATIYNFTAIGQPAPGAGDGATAWRDNARVQYRNCIFMDCGEEVVRFDGDDGDGASGYGHNGTLSWANTWTTAAGTHSSVNDGGLSAAQLDALYPVQVDGNLAEISDSVFYQNLDGNAYTEAIARGVVANSTPGAQPNDNVIAADSPITSIVRANAATKGGKTMLRVLKLNPLAANDAVASVGAAPDDGFFTPASYRGGFDSSNNWLLGWTAADAYKFIERPSLGEVLVTDNIDVSQTWTANNVYNLQDQIYVLPGATLTIEAGTIIASTPTGGGSGALAVTRGAKIYVCGTEDEPVIMTSKNDLATWTGFSDGDGDGPLITPGDPKTGTWREAANEWGNLTIMGDALISEDAFPGNTQTPTGLNQGQMEGLVPPVGNEDRAYYGGDNDDDDSGSISYLSIRYGGRVVTINEELNGLSLGGIGRATDIDHVEIMNNVDDGIEIWGGTVNLKYVSIWNIGDDSFDIDQGWRGKAQFGLIVQGYSLDTSQGSGVGDNMFEHDGAEDSDAQPVTTATIYNFTAIGQPAPGAGDGATAWRDNARVQYRNCIFMDCGEEVVRFDGDDGDGASGYGHNGTLTFAQTWTTPAGAHSSVNDGGLSAAELDALYPVQTDGFLAEIRDSVFYRNNDADAYTEAIARGVLADTNPGPQPNNNVLTLNSPVQFLVRGTAVTKGGKTMLPVVLLNPAALNDAATSADTAPAHDSFFTPAAYRGGFAPNENWLLNWTAADAFGFAVAPDTGPGGSSISSEGWMRVH